MNEKLEKAIGILTSRITPVIRPDDAQRIAQAALNLAHVKSILEGKPRTKGVGS